MQPTIIRHILEVQRKDEGFQKWFSTVATKELGVWSINSDEAFRCRGRLCVPNVNGLRKYILDKMHKSRITIHLGGAKIYKDLKRNFW